VVRDAEVDSDSKGGILPASPSEWALELEEETFQIKEDTAVVRPKTATTFKRRRYEKERAQAGLPAPGRIIGCY
jgi:hypothetical protein